MADPAHFSPDELEIEICRYLPFMTVPDPIKRGEAEKKINEMSRNTNFFYSLTNLYTKNPQKNMMVGILLRNALSATDITVKKQIEEKYYNSSYKQEIKEKLLKMSDEISLNCIARIGTLELIRFEWQNYFLECKDRSLILTCQYLKEYEYDFAPILEIIYKRLGTNFNLLLEVVEIFQGHLSDDLLQSLLRFCESNYNIEGLLKLFDNFFAQITNKEYFCDFITRQGQFQKKQDGQGSTNNSFNSSNQSAEEIWVDEEHLIQLFKILEKNEFFYEPLCLFEHLNSDDPRVVSNVEKILSNLLPKIVSRNDTLSANTRENIDKYLQENVNNKSFDKMIGCCPQISDVKYYQRFLENQSFWTFTRITEARFDQVVIYLPNIVQCALMAIEKEVNEEACTLIQTLARSVDGEMFENELSFCFIDILNSLIITSEKISYTEYSKRSAIFSTLIEIIKTCASQLKFGLEKLLFYLINKVKESLKIIDKLNENEFLILEDILTWYITLIEEILKRTAKEEYFESVYDIYYDILNIKKISSLMGDVYISLSALISQNSFFLGKMDEIVEFIVRDIKYRPGQDFYTFKAAHLLIGDISEVLSKGILKYSFLAELVITNLGSDCVQRSIKPILLSILSDLIFSLGTSFNYKDLACGMLKEIIDLDRSMDILFIDELRRSALILLDTLLLTFEEEVPVVLINMFITRIVEQDDRYHCTAQLVDLAIDFISVYGSEYQRPMMKNILYVGECAKKGKTDTLRSMIEQ
ncbi:Karyopherin (importin) beta 1 [Pseudoloma neurophilia]|uniref:Karyopherin (Importin) beta 1 n=1 Tax=Pseudoloma neurophilia TaxID=146866 RepID=A0A0R0M343_9MICR|nr:Karyopherin (importin) beta 1 [Pseudoloma neurophilia]